MSLLRDKTFTATGFAHFGVDVLNSQVGILLAYLSGPLALSNALIGLISTLFSLSGSLTQPLFGWFSDRGIAKPYAVGGILWMAVNFALAILLPGRLALVFLVIGALGSAAFHPTGAAEATRRGQSHLSRMETTAASIFFFFGQGGLFVGPLVGGPLLDLWGKSGLLLLMLIVLPAALLLQRIWHPEDLKPFRADRPASLGGVRWIIQPGLAAFITLIFLRAWTQMSVSSFLPKYLSDLGFRPGLFGPIAALFMGGAAVGGVLGGWLADRFGNRIVAFWSLAFAVLPLIGLASAQEPLTFALLTLLSGALVGAPHSIIIVLAQRMLPGRMGAASGLVLGFTFASGAIGNLISGVIADALTLPNLFVTLAVLSSVASILALTLQPSSSEKATTFRQYD